MRKFLIALAAAGGIGFFGTSVGHGIARERRFDSRRGRGDLADPGRQVVLLQSLDGPILALGSMRMRKHSYRTRSRCTAIIVTRNGSYIGALVKIARSSVRPATTPLARDRSRKQCGPSPRKPCNAGLSAFFAGGVGRRDAEDPGIENGRTPPLSGASHSPAGMMRTDCSTRAIDGNAISAWMSVQPRRRRSTATRPRRRSALSSLSRRMDTCRIRASVIGEIVGCPWFSVVSSTPRLARHAGRTPVRASRGC